MEWYILLVIDNNWLVQELSSLRPNWTGELKSFWIEKSNRKLKSKHLKNLPIIGSRELARYVSTNCSFWNFTLSKQDLQVTSNGMHMEEPRIYNSLMLISLWLWALLKHRLFVAFNIFSVENST